MIEHKVEGWLDYIGNDPVRRYLLSGEEFRNLWELAQETKRLRLLIEGDDQIKGFRRELAFMQEVAATWKREAERYKSMYESRTESLLRTPFRRVSEIGD